MFIARLNYLSAKKKGFKVSLFAPLGAYHVAYVAGQNAQKAATAETETPVIQDKD